jgi:hypothetical protein
MSLIEKMLQELNKEIDTFVSKHTSQGKYFQKQKDFITQCHTIMTSSSGSLVMREQLLNLLNQGFLTLRSAGVWKLCGRLSKIVLNYPKDILYMDEISQLSQKVGEMAGRMVLMNQELASAKSQINSFSLDELVRHLQQTAKTEPKLLNQTVLQLTHKINEQQSALQAQEQVIKEDKLCLAERDHLIQTLQQEIASLTIKNEKMFQQCEKFLVSQIPRQPEPLEVGRAGPVAFFA